MSLLKQRAAASAVALALVFVPVFSMMPAYADDTPTDPSITTEETTVPTDEVIEETDELTTPPDEATEEDPIEEVVSLLRVANNVAPLAIAAPATATVTYTTPTCAVPNGLLVYATSNGVTTSGALNTVTFGPVPAGTYDGSPAWPLVPGTYTFTATAPAGELFANGLDTYVIPDFVVLPPVTGCPPPLTCPAATSNYSTNVAPNGWTFGETRTFGKNDYTPAGLHVQTFGPAGVQEPKPGGGTQNADKAAGYISVSFPLSELCAVYMDYVNNGGATPGLQVEVDKEHDGISDKNLVGEPNAPGYGAGWWASAEDGRFNLPGAFGYQDWGTLEEYSAAWPNAWVTAIGYSLGSGVKGDGTITKIVAHNTTYTFGYVEVTPTYTAEVLNCTAGTRNNLDLQAGVASGSWTAEYDFDGSGVIDDLPTGTPGDERTTLDPGVGYNGGPLAGYVNYRVYFTDSTTNNVLVDFHWFPQDPATLNCILPTTPTAPSYNEACSVDKDTYGLPGVEITPGHNETATASYLLVADNRDAKGDGDVIISAKPLGGNSFLPPGPGDTYTLGAKGVATWTFSYSSKACPTPPASASTATGGLAHTGDGPDLSLARIAFGLMLIGGLGFWIARRRSTQPLK